MSHLTDMSRDVWKYTQAPKPEDLKGNRYLHPPKEAPKKRESTRYKEFQTIGPISCYDSEGNCFEQYDRIDIAVDVACEGISEKNKDKTNGDQLEFPLSVAIRYFEDKQQFLPSFALTCNALVWFFEHRFVPQGMAILSQYANQKKNYTVDRNYTHLQNTIIEPSRDLLVHYPASMQRASSGLKQVELPFPAKVKGQDYQNKLEDALNIPEMKISLQNLTGLPDPFCLVYIARYFGDEAIFLPPYLGSIGENSTNIMAFKITTYHDILMSLGARGVMIPGGSK